MSARAFRGTILHCLTDPGVDNDQDAMQVFEDGVLIVEDGDVIDIGPADDMLSQLGEQCPVTDYRGRFLLPGFIDCHVHYPQTNIIAAYGTQLLDWLNTYTFPFEARFADIEYARETATFFVDELLKNGTTAAAVFATVHAHSVDALFEATSRKNMCTFAGKVLMDRHCPSNLCDTPETGYRESRDLIERWHGEGRNLYAITPRFAPTSSTEQLALAGKLASEFPDTLIQTHLAENVEEVEWARSLFPDSDSYLGIYRDFGLLRDRSVFAHCIHLEDQDHASLAAHNAAIAFCPTSNLFLGSGLFDLETARNHGVRVGLATDVGGGTSFSQLDTVSEAYKVLQLRGQSLHSASGLYLATLGSAKALHLEDQIGNLLPGKAADFVVLDLESTPLLSRRMTTSQDPADQLFAQLMLADDRAIYETYVKGECMYARENP
ncbi:MAG: guanine deaminase [Pseudomonadota bacterium]